MAQRQSRRVVHKAPIESRTEKPKGKAARPRDAESKLANTLFRPAKFHPKTPGQRALCEAIDTHDIVIGTGPAGSGKSWLAVAKAVEALGKGDVNKIILFRPYVGTGRKMGSLPGDKDEKMLPYLAQLVQYIGEFFPPEQVDQMIRDKTIVLGSLEHIRSSSFKHATIILDEAQNCLKEELDVFLTRLDIGSNMIILGDISIDPETKLIKQCDLDPRDQGDLTRKIAKAAKVPGIACVEMTVADIARHPLVKAMIEAGVV